MNAKLDAKLIAIETRLRCDDIAYFKIGKSENARERFSQHEGRWHFLSIVARGDAQSINQAECCLVDYFKKHRILKRKCLNENNGGGGNDQATELYIIAQDRNADTLEHLLEPIDLFTFETINI